jgi:hypothetical protein
MAKRQITKVEDLNVNSLQVDQAYQRTPTSNVNSIVENFDEKLLGTIHVSRRSDGSLWVVDGQHRVAACKAVGRRTVRCMVHEGLSADDEAALFVGLNNSKAVLPWFTFRANVLAGSPDHVAIEQIFEARGHSLIKGYCQAVRSAEWIYQGCGARTAKGTRALAWALDVHLKAWPSDRGKGKGNERSYVDGKILKALAVLYVTYGSKVAGDDLAKKLSGTAPSMIIASARALSGGPIWSRIAFVIVGKYNGHRKSNFLPQWEIASRETAANGANGAALHA